MLMNWIQPYFLKWLKVLFLLDEVLSRGNRTSIQYRQNTYLIRSYHYGIEPKICIIKTKIRLKETILWNFLVILKKSFIYLPYIPTLMRLNQHWIFVKPFSLLRFPLSENFKILCFDSFLKVYDSIKLPLFSKNID